MPGNMGFYIVSAILILAACAAGFFAGFLYRKKIAEKEIGSAEDEATRILNDAIKSAETKKREAVVEAREEVFKVRAEADRELKERRSDVQKQERRIQQKEQAVSDAGNLVEKENRMDAIRWNMAEELTLTNYFDLDFILGYLVRVNIIHRWTALDPQRGREMLHRLVEGLTERGTRCEMQTDKNKETDI